MGKLLILYMHGCKNSNPNCPLPILGRASTKHRPHENTALPQDYQNLDLPYLLQTYNVVFAIVALVQTTTSAFLRLASFMGAFFPHQLVLGSGAPVAQGMSIFFQFGLLQTVAAAFIWCLFSVYNVGRAGIFAELSLNLALKLVAGYAWVRPGAATVAVWK